MRKSWYHVLVVYYLSGIHSNIGRSCRFQGEISISFSSVVIHKQFLFLLRYMQFSVRSLHWHMCEVNHGMCILGGVPSFRCPFNQKKEIDAHSKKKLPYGSDL